VSGPLGAPAATSGESGRVGDVDSVLLIAFGGPEKPEDIRPFLELVAAGRRIPAERLEEVAHHYEVIGGGSPLNELTRRQAQGLRRALARDPGHCAARAYLRGVQVDGGGSVPSDC